MWKTLFVLQYKALDLVFTGLRLTVSYIFYRA